MAATKLATDASEDVDSAAKYTSEQIAAVVAATGTSGDPDGYGQAMAAELFPDVLPYLIGTPARPVGYSELDAAGEASVH